MRRALKLSSKIVWRACFTLVALSLWSLVALSTQNEIFGVHEFFEPVKALALVSSAVAAVSVLAPAIVAAFFPPSLERRATDAQKVALNVALTIVAAIIVLGQIGLDVRAIFAATTIFSAALAFALQPTLQSLIAGLDLHLDRAVQVGDLIDHDGSVSTVKSMNWRTVSLQKFDGTIVLISNAKFLDAPINLHPRNKSIRLQITVPFPLGVSPYQASELMTAIILDQPAIDARGSIQCWPFEFQASSGLFSMRVSADLKPGFAPEIVTGKILSRLWYAFQRCGLVVSTSALAVYAPHGLEGLSAQDQLRKLVQPLVDPSHPFEITDDWHLLAYGPGERLIAPDRFELHQFMVLRGIAGRGHPPGSLLSLQEQPDKPQARRLAATVLSAKLGNEIGPYGSYSLWNEVNAAETEQDWRARLAAVLGDEAHRATQIEREGRQSSSGFGPGSLLQAKRNALGEVLCGDALSARTEILMAAVPPGCVIKPVVKNAASR